MEIASEITDFWHWSDSAVCSLQSFFSICFPWFQKWFQKWFQQFHHLMFANHVNSLISPWFFPSSAVDFIIFIIWFLQIMWIHWFSHHFSHPFFTDSLISPWFFHLLQSQRTWITEGKITSTDYCELMQSPCCRVGKKIQGPNCFLYGKLNRNHKENCFFSCFFIQKI